MINIPLGAEPLFHIGSWPITNAMINGWVALAVFLLVGIRIRFSTREQPGRFQHAMEMLIEAVLGFFDRVTGDRGKSRKFLPIAGTFFFFILFSNWFGLLPGTGSIGRFELLEGQVELVPILRPANSDLNLTLAMALISVIGSHLMGIVSLGFFTHMNKFIQIGSVVKALKTLNPIKILTAVVEFVVGFIEIFSEIAKVASLSLRLFGNIFAGEVLMTVISSLVSFFVPLPFMAMELLVGVVQATVFSMLTVVYLTLATSAPHGSHEEHDAHTRSPAHV